MFCKKKKNEFDEELYNAKKELFAATQIRDRAYVNFNNANSDFFEIANEEYTIAQMYVDLCMKKVKMMMD